MRIIVTGGCGYIGTSLVPALLAQGHRVHVMDAMWFGNLLDPHPHLTIQEADIRELNEIPPTDAIIHLAGVANDPCGELDPKLSWEVNALGTMRLCDLAYRRNIKRFILASSGSVYGIQGNEAVREYASLRPITEYNKTKMVAERVVISYAATMNPQIVRPGTVCGVSARQRLDVVVNAFTIQALDKGAIRVNGGEQMRSHIHIKDMVRVYLFLLANPQVSGIYNAGFENLTIEAVAGMVAEETGAYVKFTETNDIRSYCQDSSRIINAGFAPLHCVREAITDLCAAYKNGLRDDDAHYNLRVMNENGAGARVLRHSPLRPHPASQASAVVGG